jgi:ribonucleoside-diphosphate reductase alpha chain
LALVKYKKLVGGGLIKLVTNVVHAALIRLGYSEEQTSEIGNYIKANETIEGAPDLKAEHLPVFDCSLTPANGQRSIHYMGHARMMAAVQPFLSGAISKTVNLPNETTADNIMEVFMEAWRLGLKAVAVYRDGCKRTQPLSTGEGRRKPEMPESEVSSDASSARPTAPELVEGAKAYRRRLPDVRNAVVHHFSVGGQEGYLTIGLYEDGVPGEIFIRMAKEGSTVSGLMDCFATAVSLALQFGVPLRVLCGKFSHTRFEPSGWSGVKEIGYAKSLMDYIFRWLAIKFLPGEEMAVADMSGAGEGGNELAPSAGVMHQVELALTGRNGDGPACQQCGAIMVSNGSCYRCLNCGSTSGCS